jgi:YD repeat-containing protein
MRLKSLMSALAVLLCAPPSVAQTTYTYEYDQFGRLIRVERDSGASSRVRYDFDSVDNRTRVKQGVSSPSAAYDFVFAESDYGIEISGPYYLFMNDTDADLPFDSFTISAVGGTHAGYATIQSGGQSIYFAAGPGSYAITYTLMDSTGLTSTASVDIEIIPTIIITCPPDCW